MENDIDKKKEEIIREEERKEETAPPTPPPHDSYELEKEWAEKLGMNFDSSRASKPPVPPPAQPPVPPAVPPVPPVYTLPPGTQLPPLHPHGAMPPTYMIWAIISTICCCLPAGIVAIVFSSKVSTKYYNRDYEGARRASEMAEMWIIASIVAGVVFNALYFPLSLMMSL